MLKRSDKLSQKERMELTAYGLYRIYQRIKEVAQSGTISAYSNYPKVLWDKFNHKDIALGKITD